MTQSWPLGSEWPRALALRILARGEAGREQPHESFHSYVFFFPPPQKVLIYEAPLAHLDHLGLQVSISGIVGRWGIVGDTALAPAGES